MTSNSRIEQELDQLQQEIAATEEARRNQPVPPLTMDDYCDLQTGAEPEIFIGWSESAGLHFYGGPILPFCPVCRSQRQGFIDHWLSRYGQAGSFWCHQERHQIMLSDHDGAPTPIFYDVSPYPFTPEKKQQLYREAGNLPLILDYSELYLINSRAEQAVRSLLGVEIGSLYAELDSRDNACASIPLKRLRDRMVEAMTARGMPIESFPPDFPWPLRLPREAEEWRDIVQTIGTDLPQVPG